MELNHRHADYETAALPLRYPAMAHNNACRPGVNRAGRGLILTYVFGEPRFVDGQFSVAFAIFVPCSPAVQFLADVEN